VFVQSEITGLQIITQEECRQWMTANLAIDSVQEKVEAYYPHRVCYALPKEVGRLTSLARFLIRWAIDAKQPGLFWITAWGIWQSSENMALFDGYRKSLGEHRAVYAAPGHVFGESDLTELEGLVDMALWYGWDASLFDGAGSIWIALSHHGFIDAYAKNEDRLKEFQSKLEPYNLKQS
jgi:hypothetical protein